MAIRTFARPDVERFFVEGAVPRRAGWAGIDAVVRRKLDVIHYAGALGDLKSPPGNRLEAFRGALAGLHSIRVNERWRIVFRWTEDGPEDVDVVDYHD